MQFIAKEIYVEWRNTHIQSIFNPDKLRWGIALGCRLGCPTNYQIEVFEPRGIGFIGFFAIDFV